MSGIKVDENMEREFTEWTNSWWDDANHPKKRRWLLIGDSVHREYRGPLQVLCKPFNVSVDFYASSFHIEDEAFRREIQHLLSYGEYEHELILVGWGGHHGYARRATDDKAVYRSYRNVYERLLCYVMRYCRQLIIVASTPVAVKGQPNKLDEYINREIVVRNQVAREAAQKYGLLYVDHYSYVMEHLGELKFRDNKHFVNPQGSQMLAQMMLDSLVAGKSILPDGTLIEEGKKKGDLMGHIMSFTQILPDAMWHQRYHDVCIEADWLQKKAVPSSDTEAGVQSNFLYPLCRFLDEAHPKHILEFEFDAATKMVAQYAAEHQATHTVLAHDRDKVEHFMHCWKISWRGTMIHGSSLLDCKLEGKSGIVYSNFEDIAKGRKYDLILLKCPFGGAFIYIWSRFSSCLTFWAMTLQSLWIMWKMKSGKWCWSV